MTGQPIGKDSSEHEDHCLDGLPDPEHDAKICDRANLEDGEDERNSGDAVASPRDRGPGEEQPEVPLLQGAEPLSQRTCHRRIA